MHVESSIMPPSSSTTGPYATRPGRTFDRSRTTIASTAASAPGPRTSNLCNIEKSYNEAPVRTAEYSRSKPTTSNGAAYPFTSIAAESSPDAKFRGPNGVLNMHELPL